MLAWQMLRHNKLSCERKAAARQMPQVPTTIDQRHGLCPHTQPHIMDGKIAPSPSTFPGPSSAGVMQSPCGARDLRTPTAVFPDPPTLPATRSPWESPSLLHDGLRHGVTLSLCIHILARGARRGCRMPFQAGPSWLSLSGDACAISSSALRRGFVIRFSYDGHLCPDQFHRPRMLPSRESESIQ